MKWILKRCMLAAPVIMFYSLFSFHAFLISGCSTDSTHGGGGPRVAGSPSPIVTLSAYSTDSTHGGGGPRVLSLQTSGDIPAGSTVVLGCTTPGCKLASLSSTDSTHGGGGVRMLILGTIPVEIPKNTNLELRIIPKGDPAMKEMVR